MAGSRRDLALAGLGIFAAYAALRLGLPMLSDGRSGDFDFVPLASPAGFRRLEGGQVSALGDPFVGLSEPAPTGAPGPDRLNGRFCRTLFGPDPAGPGAVSIASFSDYNCPYCRVLTQRLARRAADANAGIRVIWHELPLLGPSSLAAARGALAADRQGAYLAFHERLMRSRFEATPEYLTSLADHLGIDAEQLIADAAGPEVADRIADSLALAAAFGFVGTPALVVGRTAVLGQIDDRRLDRLIEVERAAGPPPGCG